MGRTNGGGGGSSAASDSSKNFMEFAERNARLAGRLADLKVGSSELFLQTTEQTRMALCISDPNRPDCPIVYCNQAFVELTGYQRDEIVGQNCRFLQGRGTKPEAVSKLRQAVETEEYTVVDILNYRKDGTAFWNAVHVGPIYHQDGSLAYFFGSQWDITELLAARETIVENERIATELRHRTDNLFAVLAAIVRLSAKDTSDAAELSDKIERRIEALAGAHRMSLTGEGLSEDKSNLRNLVEAVLRPYRNSYADRIEIEGGTFDLSRKNITPIGLTLHELATNALKYGALSTRDGKVHVDWEEVDGFVEIRWIEKIADDSERLEESPATMGSGSGSRLIDGVIRGTGGSISTEYKPEGLRAMIRLPVAGKVAS